MRVVPNRPQNGCCSDQWDQVSADAWTLRRDVLDWLLSESVQRGVAVKGVLRNRLAGWVPCKASDLLAGIDDTQSELFVSQRPGCGGLFTTVCFVDATGCWGAWMVDRNPGEAEGGAWRALLLEGMLRTSREAV